MEEIAPVSRQAPRCRGTNRAGGPCGKYAIAGGYVCLLHGGKAPQVQESARRRLLRGADLAIDYLLNLLEPKPPCETCGRSDADRDPVVVRACQLVLDRSGYHPTLVVEQAPPHNEFENLTADELIVVLEEMLADAIAERDAQRPLLAAEEGFLVPEAEAEVPSPEGIGTLENRTDDEVGRK